MSEPIDWRALATTVIAYRDRKGFAPSTWDTLPIRLNCINSEIYELEEALGARADSSQWWPSRYEMADIAMYSLTLLHDLQADNWAFREVFHGGSRAHASAAELTAPLRKYSREAFEHWRKGRVKEVVVCLEILIVAVVDLRTRVLSLPGDLASDVHAKIAASADRPVTHGKDKRS